MVIDTNGPSELVSWSDLWNAGGYLANVCARNKKLGVKSNLGKFQP